MIPMVRFRAGGASYAVPVSDVRQVRLAADVSALPQARSGVAGIIRQDGAALPVLSILGGSERVLLLEAGGRGYGLLVEEVSTVTYVDEARLGPPPDGQDAALVTGVLNAGEDLVLVLDAMAVGTRVLG